MECRELQLGWDEALELYQQLSTLEAQALLEDGLPNKIEDLPALALESIADEAAKAFLRQFRGAPARSFFTLRLEACLPDRFQSMAARFAQTPTAQRFLAQLAQLDGTQSSNPVEYLARQEFSTEELDQLQRLAAVVAHLNPSVTDEELRFFCHALRHAMTLGILAASVTALETLTRVPFHIRISEQNNRIRETEGTVRDLASQILSLVALADLEAVLARHIPTALQGQLPVPIAKLRHIREALIAGAIRSHYNPAEIATAGSTVARYDAATNTIEYGVHCDAAHFLSQRLNARGLRYPSQVALHELLHGAQDSHGGVFAPNQAITFWHHHEAEATFTEMFYVRLKDGAGFGMDFAPPNDTSVGVDDFTEVLLQQYLGMTLPRDLPSTDYRGLAVQLVEEYLAQMFAGGKVTGVDLREVAARRANSQAILDLLRLLVNNNMAPIKTLAQQAKTQAPLKQRVLIVLIDKDGRTLDYPWKTLRLPQQLRVWGDDMERSIQLMTSYYDRMKTAQDPSSWAKLQYALWSGGFQQLISSMVEYAVYRHAADATFDTKQFITERLFPMARLRYQMPANPASRGVKIPIH